MDTPKPGVYGIRAHDVQHTVLKDSGSLTVVGVKRISGNGKFSENDSSANLTAAETIVVKKGGSVALTATPDPDAVIVTARCGESEKRIKVVVYELGLSLSKSKLTLKHDCEAEITVVANPSSEFSTPTIQVKRNDIGVSTWPDWMDLVSGGGSIDWKARVAGVFELRARAQIAGEECLSDERDMTVEFPSYDQITADATVQTAMNDEWQATLNDGTALLAWLVFIDCRNGRDFESALPRIKESVAGNSPFGKMMLGYGFAYPIAAAIVGAMIVRRPRGMSFHEALPVSALAALTGAAMFALVYSFSLAPDFHWHL